MAGLHPPLEGEGRLTRSEAIREAGGGDVSTYTRAGGEITPPRSPASRAIDPPPPGEGGRGACGTIVVNDLKLHLRDVRLRSRGAFRVRVMHRSHPRATRVRGRPGADWHLRPACGKNTGGRNHRFSRNDPAFPAQWFSRLLRALPGAPG